VGELSGNGITLPLAWLISTATLLPLLPPTLLLRSRESAVTGQRKGRLRTALTVLVSVLLAAYPDSQITILLPSTGYPSDLTPTEAESEAMNSMCFSSGMPQATLILPFHIVALLGWLLMVLLIIRPALMLAVAKLVSALRCMTIQRTAAKGEKLGIGTEKKMFVEPEKQQRSKLMRLWEDFDGPKHPAWGAISIVLLVIAYQMRRVQQSASGASYVDNEWGFGQIAAIAMYGPVLLEVMGSVGSVSKGKKEHRNTAPGKQDQAAGSELGFRRIKTV